MRARLPRITIKRDANQAALDGQLARSLGPISFVLSGMYATSVVHRMVDPMLAAATAPTAIVPTVTFLVLGLLLWRRPLPARLANPVMLLSLGFLAVETMGRGEIAAGVNLHWSLIGLGAVALRPRWAIGSGGPIVAPWVVGSALGVNGWALPHGAFVLDMVTASALGSVVFIARRRAVVGLVAARRDLQRLVISDPLTGLRNRRGIEQAAVALMGRADGPPVSILFVDLDGFKLVNDRLGHSEGDRALVSFAEVLRDSFRTGDVLGRVGGDEFVVLMAPTSDVASAAARLEESLATWRDHSGRYDLQASIGLGQVGGTDLESFWAAVDAADRRMYRAKLARRVAQGEDPAEAEPAGRSPDAAIPEIPGDTRSELVA